MRVKGDNGLIFDVVDTVATGLIGAGYVEKVPDEQALPTAPDSEDETPDNDPDAGTDPAPQKPPKVGKTN
jgi:hypothetical protein